MGSTRDMLKRRARKTVKWGGAWMSAFLLVIWIGAFFVNFTWPWPGGNIASVYGGRFMWMRTPIDRGPAAPKSSWELLRFPQFKLGLPYYQSRPSPYLLVPLWCPALLSLLATAAAWRADAKYLRRARVGLCVGCGYDRAGLVAGVVCPECGEPAEAR